MKLVILDSVSLGDDINLSPLGEATVYGYTPPELVAERIRDAEIVMLNKLKLNESNLKDAKKLRLICVTATGYDNIDTEYCKAHGIALCNVPGYSTDSVAQLTLTMALSLVMNLPDYRGYVHSGEYSKRGIPNRLTPVWHELCGMTWGIVGAGAIGQKVAAVAKAIGCNVIVCRRTKDPEYETVDIDTLCQRADVISVHVPLNDSTRNMINADRISKMKDTAVFVNVARGAVTDEKALAEAILNNKLGALGVDVYSVEPFGKDHPFNDILDRDNVCLTPHMAWGALEARNRCIEIIADNIASFQGGGNLNRIV